MYQFYARFPFQFRLSQWDFELSDSNKKKVIKYLESKKSDANHLLISGDLSKGKTSLGIGMLNELSIKNNTCLYVSAMKMYNYFFSDEGDVLKNHEIWNWKTTHFLLIDDINPTEPIQNDLVTPTILQSFIDTKQTVNQKNRDILNQKNVIWILGSKLDRIEEQSWISMLNRIGITDDKISVIHL